MSSELIARSNMLSLIFHSDYQWLTRKLRKRIASGHDAEDVASEAFVRLAAMPELLNINEPRAMLTTLAQRVLYESWRRRDLERAYLEALADTPERYHPSAEQVQQILDALLMVDKALQGLSSKARQAFLYSQLDGLTYAEIAEILGVSFGMVRKYISTALTQCYVIAEHLPD